MIKGAIWILSFLLLQLTIAKAGNKPLDVSIGIHTAYTPYCNINNELNLYYVSQGTPSQLQYVLRSKLNVYDIGAFVDFKYFRANLYRTKCITSDGSGSGSQQVFRNNTHTGFYRLYENEILVNEEIYKADYVSADYQATSGSFLLKYPVKEIFFPYAGLGFSNIRKMDLDGNGVDDYTYGTPSSRLSVYGVDTVGSESGRTRTLAFLSVGAGIIKHLGEFSVELLWGMDFGIDGRKPFTKAYQDYQESRYSSGAQNAELTAKSRGYYRMSIGFTFAYTFSIDTKSKQQVKPASAPAVEAF
ncbi:MAG: hypothetical protein WAQ28_09705 [Bacteroidia bacterium]